MSQKPEEIIPAQQEGVAVDVEDSITCNDESAAKELYLQVKERLLNIGQWHQYAGTLSANFELTDASGNGVGRLPEPGDYFKISIPAPGIQTGEGFDWVRVENIEDKSEKNHDFVAIRVRPASSPLNANKDIAHFYSNEATSNFIVQRKDTTVTASVYGRNEKPNVEKAETVLDKVRNAIVGTTGVAIFGKFQWKALVSGLLQKK